MFMGVGSTGFMSLGPGSGWNCPRDGFLVELACVSSGPKLSSGVNRLTLLGIILPTIITIKLKVYTFLGLMNSATKKEEKRINRQYSNLPLCRDTAGIIFNSLMFRVCCGASILGFEENSCSLLGT